MPKSLEDKIREISDEIGIHVGRYLQELADIYIHFKDMYIYRLFTGSLSRGRIRRQAAFDLYSELADIYGLKDYRERKSNGAGIQLAGIMLLELQIKNAEGLDKVTSLHIRRSALQSELDIVERCIPAGATLPDYQKAEATHMFIHGICTKYFENLGNLLDCGEILIKPYRLDTYTYSQMLKMCYFNMRSSYELGFKGGIEDMKEIFYGIVSDTITRAEEASKAKGPPDAQQYLRFWVRSLCELMGSIEYDRLMPDSHLGKFSEAYGVLLEINSQMHTSAASGNRKRRH